MLRPAADWELASFLSEASADERPVEIFGGRTKVQYGRPRSDAAEVSTHVMRGIQSYRPGENLVVAQAGCLVSDIERELAAEGQMLPFEPLDLAAVYAGTPGKSTIGGIVASNLSGARRIIAGGISDNLLGVKAVAGSGEIFESGINRAQCGSNGINLAHVIPGSWGTLAALVEVTLRVTRIPDQVQTLVMFGQSEEIAIEAMSAALRTPYGVTGTLHLEPVIAARLPMTELSGEGLSITAIRFEADSPAAASSNLDRLIEGLQAYGVKNLMNTDESYAFWREVQRLAMLPYSETPLWRLSVRPSLAFGVVTAIRRYMDVDAMYDWSGGLIWLEVPASADAGATEIRRVIAATGGHATLVRASDNVKASVDVFEPMHSGVELLSRKLKQVFDPAGILSPGRMYADL